MKSKKVFISIFIVLLIIIIYFIFFNMSKFNILKSQEKTSVVSIDNDGFVNEQAFNYIKDCYNKVDFSSDFKQGDYQTYDYYKKQYQKLLDCKVSFKVKDTREEYFINQYGEIKKPYNPIDYIYYFFDIDSDNLPELCITDESRFIYVIKYNSDSDEFILWHEVPPSWIELLGSGKLWLYSGKSPINYAFFQLDKNGNVEFTIRYYIEQRNDQEKNDIETIYMLTLPEFSDSIENIDIPEEIKMQSVEKDSHFYFHVTEDQKGDTLTCKASPLNFIRIVFLID